MCRARSNLATFAFVLGVGRQHVVLLIGESLSRTPPMATRMVANTTTTNRMMRTTATTTTRVMLATYCTWLHRCGRGVGGCQLYNTCTCWTWNTLSCLISTACPTQPTPQGCDSEGKHTESLRSRCCASCSSCTCFPEGPPFLLYFQGQVI